MFEAFFQELGFHGICRFHPPKTFLVAVVLMVLTSLVRDLQASEVWQKLPSQVGGGPGK